MQTTLGITLLLALATCPVGAQRPDPPAIRVTGAGLDTWVLLSGMMGGTAGFRQLESRLVTLGYQVITIDPYQLSLDSADVSFDAMARRVASVLSRLDARSVQLVGHSHGGGVALRVAARIPAEVTSLHLMDVGAMPAQQGRVFSSAIRVVPIITHLPGGRAFVRRRIVAGLRENSARHEWLTPDAEDSYSEPLLDRIGAIIAMAVRLGRRTRKHPTTSCARCFSARQHGAR